MSIEKARFQIFAKPKCSPPHWRIILPGILLKRSRYLTQVKIASGNFVMTNPILDYFLNTVSKQPANGIEILQSIKKNYPHIHVIMLSGQEKYGVTLQSIQKGAEQYVMKDKNAFAEIVRMAREMG